MVTHHPQQPSVDLPAFQPPTSFAVLLLTWISLLLEEPEYKGFSLITKLKLTILTADDSANTN